MQQACWWMTVVVLCSAAGAAAGETPPDARLLEAQTAYEAAIKLYEAGQHADAIARGEHALALREAALGGTHPDVARSLDTLGLHLLLQGNCARAEPLLQRALALREAALGQDHLDVAQTLHNLTSLYLALGAYARARPLGERALAIREAALGKNHPDVAQSLQELADAYSQQGGYARAEPLYLRALAIREAALGKHHPDLADSLNNLGELYRMQGLYDQAEPLLQRALTIVETALGKDHPYVAIGLNNLANLYREQGLYDRARPLYERALSTWEAAASKNHPDVAWTLAHLADLYIRQGLYDRVEPLLQRALAIRETTLGRNHPLVAGPLRALADHYSAHALYGQAEPLYERALAILEEANGKDHPRIAYLLISLTGLYEAQGLHAQAEPLLQRARAILESEFGKNHPDVAWTLNRLGRLYVAQGLYERARPLYERALAILEALLGKNHPDVGGTLNNLGRLYVAQGSYTRAEPILRRALAIGEAANGKNAPPVAHVLNNLAEVYLAQGAYARARPLYDRALAIWELHVGKEHPKVAETLNNLARVHLAQHRLTEALPLLTRAFAIAEQRLRREALGLSEARLASFLQLLRTDEERLYALLREHPDDASVRRLALGASLLLRGRSVEEMASISRTVYQSLGAQDRGTFDQLMRLRTQLAHLSLQGPGSLPLTVYQQRLEELAEQGAALETDLARRSAPLRALTTLPSPSEIVDRVAAALPLDGALVEFITYVDRPLVPHPGAPEPQRPNPQRYLALVLLPDATIRAIDLGPAEPIDRAASRLRHALAIRDAASQPPAQALYQLAFQPLLPLLGETHRLFLAPDGQLGMVPFAALHDGYQFLVETFDFTYLTSGKDLLPRPQGSSSPGTVVVLADPDFSAPLEALPDTRQDAPKLAGSSLRGERFFSTLRAELTHRAWAPTPLPGTRHEAKAIQRLLPQAQLFLGAEATKERLLHLSTPGILHLATHGFFREDVPPPTASRAVGHFGALGEDMLTPPPPDPLLRSGLLFAGASSPAPSGSSPGQSPLESTLVTALELASLNLWGTQLVVLSACDTGRGDVKLGQGVYGLRRAFVVAGAETVVMSLWKVDDDITRHLMERYYRNLLAGQGRAAALSEAMRELRRTQPDPYYWAPFISLGQDMPLRSLDDRHEFLPGSVANSFRAPTPSRRGPER